VLPLSRRPRGGSATAALSRWGGHAAFHSSTDSPSERAEHATELALQGIVRRGRAARLAVAQRGHGLALEAQAERDDERGDLLVLVHGRVGVALHVQDLAAKRQHRLEAPVARLRERPQHVWILLGPTTS